MRSVSEKGWVVSVILVAVAVVVGLTWCLLPSSVARKAEAAKTLRSRRIKTAAKPIKDVRRQRIDVVSGGAGHFKGFGKTESKGDFGWKEGEDPFATMPSFDFDDEDLSLLTDDLRSVLKEMSVSFTSKRKDKERVLAAVQKLLAMIYANGGNGGRDIPKFVKEAAIGALNWLGADGASELVGMMGDSDPEIVAEARSTLMDQLMDFDARESDQVALIKQMLKLETLDAGDYDAIMFTVSMFKNSNKVDVSLAVMDSGKQLAIDVFKENADFIFDAAASDAIQTRADIVQYGKDHPDSENDFGFDQEE